MPNRTLPGLFAQRVVNVDLIWDDVRERARQLIRSPMVAPVAMALAARIEARPTYALRDARAENAAGWIVTSLAAPDLHHEQHEGVVLSEGDLREALRIARASVKARQTTL